MIIDGIDIVKLIGKDATIRLAEEFGGLRIYVRLRRIEESPVSKAIGLEAAQKLSDVFRTGQLHIPLCREILTEHYLDIGFTQAKIARTLRITEGGVVKIVRRLERYRRNDA